MAMQMTRSFKIMLFVNAMLVMFYLVLDYVHYSMIGVFNKTTVSISTSLPWYVRYEPIPDYSGGFSGGIWAMYTDSTAILTLILFLTAVVVNLYLAFRIQKSKATS